MSQEIWKIVTSQEIDRLDMQIAMQCAPLISGLKISNLLNIRCEDFSAMQEMVEHSRFSWYRLAETEEKMTVLLYHKESLERYLARPAVRAMLAQEGYTEWSLDAILHEFARRYAEYRSSDKVFPHEMGLLLGYPIEDVAGFITHRGDDCLCSGYWKVYANKERKLKIFEGFEKAKERLIQLLSGGLRMADILALGGLPRDIQTVQ